jgi:hypothetical protein
MICCQQQKMTAATCEITGRQIYDSLRDWIDRTIRLEPNLALMSDEPIDEIKVILCQFIGLLDQDGCLISFFKRRRFVRLTFAELIGCIKHLLSLPYNRLTTSNIR